MKKQFTEEQIVKSIKRHESEVKVDELCRELGISAGTFYNWRSKYAGLEFNESKRLKKLELENNKLKRLLAERLLEIEAMKDVLSKFALPYIKHLLELKWSPQQISAHYPLKFG